MQRALTSFARWTAVGVLPVFNVTLPRQRLQSEFRAEEKENLTKKRGTTNNHATYSEPVITL